MKKFLILSIVCLVSCGKNSSTNETPFSPPLNPQQKLATENNGTNETNTYKLTDKEINISFPPETTEVTVTVSPDYIFEPTYKESEYHLPIREHIPHLVMGYYVDRPDVKCLVKRQTYKAHLSRQISNQLISHEDLEFFFNGKRVQPEILENSPLTFKLDFRTLESKRSLVIKNKSIKEVLKYSDDKTECDWVLRQNQNLEIFPEYVPPKEKMNLPSYKSFQVTITQ